MRHRRRRGIATPVVDKHLHVISQQYLHSGNLRRLAQCMRIPPNKNRAANALRITVIHNGLRSCQNMVLVERIIQRRPPVPRCTKHHLLVGIIGIRNPGVVCRHHFRNINKVFRQCNLAGTLMSHTKNSSQKRKNLQLLSIFYLFPPPRTSSGTKSHILSCTTMKQTLAVGLGAGCGATLRMQLTPLLYDAPTALIIINAIGCFLIATWAFPNDLAQKFFAPGLLGGFTSFSTFALTAATTSLPAALSYSVLTITSCLGAWAIGDALRHRRHAA